MEVVDLEGREAGREEGRGTEERKEGRVKVETE